MPQVLSPPISTARQRRTKTHKQLKKEDVNGPTQIHVEKCAESVAPNRTQKQLDHKPPQRS
ncbi:unnamed protein product [Clonostachys byssicola]|uniref:Uncharacterized protein n=1 Tax=Clonostachys byssicola TaxID=160290 RepID=A0A9N9UX61_9HYPO|nr:unnamed protein product [Clonostachys byssicola]